MNAKDEFINHLGCKYPKCAFIEHNPDFYGDSATYLLLVNFTAEQYSSFIESLDFGYNNGYGLQELYGTIWYKDGTWSDRWEYDGSEGWQHHSCPPIPDSLR
jgi:hypothetical protein